jgi:hypothetical protein
MQKFTSLLAVSLLTISTLLAAPEQDKQGGRPQNGKPVKVDAEKQKPSTQKVSTVNQPSEGKYQIVTTESTKDADSVSSRQITGDKVNLIVGVVVLFLLIGLLAFYFMRRRAPSGSASATPGSADGQLASGVINSLSLRLNSLATASDVSKAQTSINASIATLGSSLVLKVAEASIAAMAKSELGELRQKLANALSELDKAKRESVEKDSQIAAVASGSESAQKSLTRLESEKADLVGKLSIAQSQLFEVTSRLEASGQLVQAAQTVAIEHQAEIERLRGEVNKAYEVLAPAKLKETELRDQVQAMYQESLSGNAASISVWTTLTAFVSAQADPAAKDFQLQIVRRLGLSLVNYWKQQGLTDKERHDKLLHWAKSLNEHADGRYNLLVPSLGEPVDRSRMSCATTVTVVREVLCWQVRNPAGANFSLAEVA